jgi:hypothetical protein
MTDRLPRRQVVVRLKGTGVPGAEYSYVIADASDDEDAIFQAGLNHGMWIGSVGLGHLVGDYEVVGVRREDEDGEWVSSAYDD